MRNKVMHLSLSNQNEQLSMFSQKFATPCHPAASKHVFLTCARYQALPIGTACLVERFTLLSRTCIESCGTDLSKAVYIYAYTNLIFFPKSVILHPDKTLNTISLNLYRLRVVAKNDVCTYSFKRAKGDRVSGK